MRYYFRFGIAVALIAGVAVPVALYFRTSRGPVKVTVGQVSEFFLYMPLYIAKDRGFFEKENLDVTVVTTGGDDKSVAGVISGSIDFGVGDPTFAAIAAARGQKVKVVASVVNGVPFWGVARENKVPEIREPSQLRGLTVATFPAPSTAYTLQAQMFRTGGLEPNIRQAQFGTLLTLLRAGEVDIALELEPNVSTATAAGARVVYSLTQLYGDFAITGVTVLQSSIDTRRPVIEAFVRALDKAEKFAHADPEAAIAFAKSKFATLDPTIVEGAMKRILASGTLPANTMIPDDAWRKAIKLRVETGDLPNEDSAMPVLDNSIARSVQ